METGPALESNDSSPLLETFLVEWKRFYPQADGGGHSALKPS